MFETLVDIDRLWLLAINGGHSPWLDEVMWAVSRPMTWLPLYLLLIALVVWQYAFAIEADKRTRLCRVVTILLATFLAVGLSDIISSSIIKPLVGRPRPTHEVSLEGLVHIVRGYRGGAFGFVSSHAANTMAVLVMMSLLWYRPIVGPKMRYRHVLLPILIGFVLLNCYSRMYLGVHYPLDITGGLLVGGLVAWGIYVLLRRVMQVRDPRAETFIALRLYFSQNEDQRHSKARPAIRFATAGITVGMVVMMLTLSIIVGFKQTITDKVAGFGSHIQVLNFDNNSTYELEPVLVSDTMLETISGIEHVSSVHPFVTKPGMLKTDTEVQGIVLKGTEHWDFFARNLLRGRLPETENEVMLSRLVAERLQVDAGQTILAYCIEGEIRARKLQIVGIYDTGFAEADNLFVMCHPQLIRRINKWKGQEWSGIDILIDDLRYLDPTAIAVYEHTANRVDEEGRMLKTETLIDKNPQIFAWIDLLDMNVVVIIVLMLFVCGFTIITGLIILILDHIRLIGTLKALGARNTFVRRIFITQAMLLIAKGMLLGNGIGLVLCWLQYRWHLLPLDPVTYYVNYVPIAFPWAAFVLLNIGTLLLSVLILLAPSAIVSRISPARVMHFE